MALGALWVPSFSTFRSSVCGGEATSEGSVEGDLVWEDVCCCYPQLLEPLGNAVCSGFLIHLFHHLSVY